MLRPFFKENDSEFRKKFYKQKSSPEESFFAYLTTITLQRA